MRHTYNGTALETGSGNARDYEGFQVNWTKTEAENSGHSVDRAAKTLSGTILGDGSLVLAFYYDRATYTVTYEYVITEVNNHLAGYTYDTTVYTVTYIVEQEGDSLKATRLFRKDGKDVSIAAFEFNNTYKTPVPSPTPKTGDSENLALWLNLLIGSLLALIAALRGKKRLYAR